MFKIEKFFSNQIKKLGGTAVERLITVLIVAVLITFYMPAYAAEQEGIQLDVELFSDVAGNDVESPAPRQRDVKLSVSGSVKGGFSPITSSGPNLMEMEEFSTIGRRDRTGYKISLRSIEETIKSPSRLFLTATGYLAGFIFHEIGHQSVADSRGVRMDWDIKTNPFASEWFARVRSRKDVRDIMSSGLVAQAVSSEVILNSGFKRNPFLDGWLIFNVSNTVGYIFIGAIGANGDDEVGDIKSFGHYGGNKNALKIFAGVQAASVIYRVATGSKPWFDTRYDPEKKAVIIGKIWLF